MTRVTVVGTAALQARLAALARAAEAAAAVAVGEGAEALRAAARELVDRTAAQASRPGRPPRRVTGALAASIAVRRGDGGASATVGSGLDYAAHLEFGTTRMAPRPWLGPSFAAVRPALRARLLRALRGSLAR